MHWFPTRRIRQKHSPVFQHKHNWASQPENEKLHHILLLTQFMLLSQYRRGQDVLLVFGRKLRGTDSAKERDLFERDLVWRVLASNAR